VDLRGRIDHEIHSITGIRMRVELVATGLAHSEGKTQRVCDHRLALKADPSALPWPPLRQRPTRAANVGSATLSRGSSAEPARRSLGRADAQNVAGASVAAWGCSGRARGGDRPLEPALDQRAQPQ